MSECACYKPPFFYLDFDEIELGDSGSYGSVSLQTCKKCGAKWVKYLIEEPHHTKSGRWWRAPISNEDSLTLTAENALEYVERQEWCLAGGSYYEGVYPGCDHKCVKPIRVR